MSEIWSRKKPLPVEVLGKRKEGNEKVSLKSEVRGDISICEEIIANNDISEAKKHIGIFVAAYENYIPGIANNLNFYTGMLGTETNYIGDILKIKKVLEVFLSDHCQLLKPSHKYNKKEVINIHSQNTNTNVNKTSVSVEITFERVRREIEENGNLHQKEIEEILSKLDEIEEVSNSSDSRNKKWASLKGSLEWLGTKGVDIATKILPLITKTIES